MPGGPMDPHNVLPICFRWSSHVKKQARGPRPQASALAKLYLRKRKSLPSLSQKTPDELLTKTLDRLTYILDESLRAGQQYPIQRIGNEGSSCNPIPKFGTSTDHASNSVPSSLRGKGAPYNSISGAPYRPLSKSMFGSSIDHATNSVTSSARGAGATTFPVSQTAFGSFTGPTINPGRPSVASAGKLSINVPTPATPFLGTRGAPVAPSLFGSLSSHCGNSRVASMADAGAIVAPVSQTMFGTLTDPAKTLGMMSVANAGTSENRTLTPGAPYSVTDDPVLLSDIGCISRSPENSGVRLMINSGPNVAAVTDYELCKPFSKLWDN